MGHTEDFADGGGGYGGIAEDTKSGNGENKNVSLWSLLTDFTSNPATPTKTSHRKGSWKTLFYCLLFPTLLPILLPNKTQHQCLKVAKVLVSFL